MDKCLLLCEVSQKSIRRVSRYLGISINMIKKNGQKAAKNKYYLQMVNQLRRNVFNLDLKREIVAAKTNVKHFFSL